ncbi:uncharacterized protein F4817DRAFT_341744 [Daldinia loculata]|uniref:uncharacterized protein n=1 Tax=Daldinia loculata TaxID=103429 RepID=UPI0020C57C6F|nr:uncharacterized protein F4817DRAFT_341744 [Daldinia loculata]KAI1646050.1 hypothetical protein F4817DRAFT_341744 [Daldinia loculata]
MPIPQKLAIVMAVACLQCSIAPYNRRRELDFWRKRDLKTEPQLAAEIVSTTQSLLSAEPHFLPRRLLPFWPFVMTITTSFLISCLR